MTSISTRLTELLGIEHPVLLAPMDLVADGRLAAAVSQAGGFGIIGGGYGDEAWLTREMDAAGDARVGVGFITWSMAKRPKLLDMVLERHPPAVMLSFGDVRPHSQKIKRAGALLICQVQTLEQVGEAVSNGADVLVAQGAEGGGHGISRSTFPFVPAVVDAAPDIPVAAAGGIGDGRGLAAALMLGADGVLVGTRFYASAEALAHPAAKAKMAAATGEETIRSSTIDIVRDIPWPAEFTARIMTNAFTKRWHGAEAELAAAKAREMPRYQAAVTLGDFSTARILGGEAMGLFDAVLPAGEIVERIVTDAERALRASARLITG